MRLLHIGYKLWKADDQNKIECGIDSLTNDELSHIVQAVNAYDASQALIAEQAAAIVRYKSALEKIKAIAPVAWPTANP